MKKVELFLQFALLASLIAACVHTEEHAIVPADVSAVQTWGQAVRVTQLKHLYFADQPDTEALKIASEKGVVAVINLRNPEEIDWDEKAAAESLGMQYYNIPIMTASPSFDPAVISQIEAAVAAQDHAPVLLHCSSSNRVGAWLAIHLADKHKMDKQQALAVGRKAGMTKNALENRVKLYWAQ
ncbi:MAG: hypothetical protein KJP25_00590 [Gammaproteobacteria bacterium]|nr:hypothetical protein [Gammaproteobacteria bacterium]NNM10823.1 hypothetical protein [Pseudomonadales bacterium]